MTDGEGNKPAISLLEEQEKQKRRPGVPSQAPAPYVQPYRPSPSGPPVAGQPNASNGGAGGEGSLRSYLSNISYSNSKPPLHANSGSAHGAVAATGGAGGGNGSATPAAPGAADGLAAPYNHAQVSNMLAYSQQQLTQLQQVQTLLLQHMQALHQLQGNGNTGGAISRSGGSRDGAAAAALESAFTGRPHPGNVAAVMNPTARVDGYSPAVSTALPTQISSLGKPLSVTSQAASHGPDRPVAQPSIAATLAAMGPRPPSGSGAAVLPHSPPRSGAGAAVPPRAGGPSPPGAGPPRPPEQASTALKDHPSVGSAACPETPAPGSPESAVAAGDTPQLQQQQPQDPERRGQPPPSHATGLQAWSEQLRPTSQHEPGPPIKQQPPPLGGSGDVGPSLIAVSLDHGQPPGAAPGLAAASSGPAGKVADAAQAAIVEATAGDAWRLASHPLATVDGATAAAVANAVGLDSVQQGCVSSAAVRPASAGPSRDGGAAVASAGAAMVTDSAAPTQQQLAPPAVMEPPCGGPPAPPPGNPLTSVFAAPGPGVRLPSTAGAADEMRPLAVVSLSVGLHQGAPHELPPPLGLPGAAALAPTGQFGPQQPLDRLFPEQQLAAAAQNPYGHTVSLASPSAVAVADLHARAAAVDAAAAPTGDQPARAVGFEPIIENVGPGGSELDAQLDANRKDFLVFPEDEDDPDDDELEDVRRKPWYRRSGVLWFVFSALTGVVLLVAGLSLQLRKFTEAAAEAEGFRWLYFVAGYVPIYWVVYFAVSRSFMLVEWVYFRENLFYLENVKVNTTQLISMLFQLLWFQACFKWLWCEKHRCSSATFLSARDATWKAVLCIMLFTLANLLKAVTAKFSSMHFYRTAHFMKLKDSLEKEYYLQLLSVPRSRILAQIQAAQAEAEANEAGGRYRLKTVLTRRSLFPPSATLQRLSRRTPLAHTAGDGLDAAAAAGGGAASGANAGDRRASASKGAHRSGGSADAAVRHAVGKDLAEEGRELARGSTAPANCGTWAGFWRFGARPRSARSEQTGARQAGGGSLAGSARGDSGSGRGSGGGIGDGGRYAGSPPKWSANALAATSTVSLALLATPSAHGSAAAGSGGGGTTANGCEQMSRAGVTVVVVGDGSPTLATAAGQAGPPPPPAAPPAPPPPPPPASLVGDSSAASGGSASGGAAGALGFVTAEPFLTQTSATLDRARAAPSSAPQAQQPQQPQLPQGHGAQPPSAAMEAETSGGRVMSWRFARLLSRFLGGRSAREATEAKAAPAAREARVAGRSASGGLAMSSAPSGRYSFGRSSQSLPPRRLKTILSEAAEAVVGPELQRRLAELGTEAFHVVPLDIKKKKAVHDMTEVELERIRDTIVIKTYTALIRKHSAMSEAEQLRELKTVKRFAKALFYNMRGPDPNKTYITLSDFKLFFGDDEDMAQKAFKVFDVDRDEKLTRVEIRDRVVAIYAERRNMARSLRDTDSIVRSLELSLGIAIHFLFGAIYLTIWGVPILEGFSTFSATVLALTFIFGNSAKNAFESVLFLFSQHPYDVGDMVYFNGDSMRVKRISLLYTDFVKWTNEEVYVPNTKMMTVDLTNWTRTKTKFELHKILVDVGVPWEVKQDISNALVAHCNLHPNDFCGTPRVTFREVVDPLKVYLGIGFTYNFPPDDFDRLIPARDRIMFVIQSKLREHKLVFSHHRINQLEASEEIRVALQMRQLQSLEAAERSLLDDFLVTQPQQAPGQPRGPGAGANGAPGSGLLAGGGALPPVAWQPPPELLMAAGGGAGTSSALPALGAEGLQQRPAAAAAAAAAASPPVAATTAAAGAAEPGAGEQTGKSKKD